MNTTRNPGFLVQAAWFAVVASTLAANFAIPWYSVDGGGGTSTSGDGRFSVSGTAGPCAFATSNAESLPVRAFVSASTARDQNGGRRWNRRKIRKASLTSDFCEA